MGGGIGRCCCCCCCRPDRALHPPISRCFCAIAASARERRVVISSASLCGCRAKFVSSSAIEGSGLSRASVSAETTPVESARRCSAPWKRSSSAGKRWPAAHASMSGVHCGALSCALTWLPASIKSWSARAARSESPCAAPLPSTAAWAGVKRWWRGLRQEGSAPRRRHAPSVATSPASAARKRAKSISRPGPNAIGGGRRIEREMEAARSRPCR